MTFADPQSTVIVDALIVSALAAVRVTPLGAISRELPPLSATRTVLVPSSRVICCPPGVDRVSVTAPAVSSIVIVIPVREVSERMSLFALMVSGAASTPFHSEPTTYGQSGSPPPKQTSTSSPISGMNQLPRLSPALIVASRAHTSYSSLPVSGDHGSRTWTRPWSCGSWLSDTVAG